MRKQGPTREFRAAPGASFSDDQAQRYGMFLERKVGLAKGLAAPEAIVDASRPATAPTHGEFEWDDGVAAEAHRVHQARQLVNHILVVHTNGGEPVTTKAFHSVTVIEGDRKVRGYTSEKLVWSKPELAEQVVAEAFRELESWRAKYHQYADLRDAVAGVDRVIKRARGKKAA